MAEENGEAHAAEVARIAELEKQLRESKAHLNNIVALLELCNRQQKAPGAEEAGEDDTLRPPEVVIAALGALRRTFARLHVSGELARAAKGSQRQIPGRARPSAAAGGDKAEAEKAGGGGAEEEGVAEAERAYLSWLMAKYTSFLRAALRLLLDDEPRLQVAGLAAGMDFVGRHARDFNANLFASLLRCLVSNRNLSGALLQAFLSRYLSAFDDVRYYTTTAVARLAARRLAEMAKEGAGGAGAESSGSEDEGDEGDAGGGRGGKKKAAADAEGLEKAFAHRLSPHALSRNLFDLLSRVQLPSDSAALRRFMPATLKSMGLAEDGSKPAAPAEGGKRKREAGDGGEQGGAYGRLGQIKHHRKAFSDAWLAFLKLPLPADVYKRVLVRLHRDVMPHMGPPGAPLLLADFLTRSYDQGGVVSILALNGLFVLISKYNLDYPSFYAKLRSLLEPQLFHAKHRARFLKLLDLFMTSTHLSAYLVAAFAKRLARLALSAPPSGASFCAAFAANLLRRHPACLPLIHRSASAPGPAGPQEERAPVLESPFADVSADSLEGGLLGGPQPKRPRAQQADGAGEAGAGAERPGADPYDDFVEEPAACRALDSSLWELEALRGHYDPEVARLVAIFEAPLNGRGEIDVSGPMTATYQSTIDGQLRRRLPKGGVALAYHAPLPLFPTERREAPREPAAAVALAADEVFLEGWAFS
eukprot:tig00000553_g2124.t1